MIDKELEKKANHPADTNGDGKVSDEEHKMFLEFKRKELDDQDAMRDAQRKMAWFALFGMLLYPFAVVIASVTGVEQASTILGDMASNIFCFSCSNSCGFLRYTSLFE